MKKHLFTLLAISTGVGIGFYALAADPPAPKPTPTPTPEPKEPKRPVIVGGTRGFVPESNEFDEFSQPSRSPAEIYSEQDPAFSKYVELSLLTEAMAGSDASLLADVALGLAEGERILVRTHRSGMTADGLMSKTVKLAVLSGDKTTQDRITSAATAHNKPQWAKLIVESKEFGGASRDGPMVSLSKIDGESVSLMESVRQACYLAGLTGRKSELEELKKSIAGSGIDAKVKAYLIDQIDSCAKGLPEKPDTISDVLDEFSAASRAKKPKPKPIGGLELGGSSPKPGPRPPAPRPGTATPPRPGTLQIPR